MNAKELAELLNGREYLREITRDEEAQAKAAGLVVAFGASDDLLEFRGGISDEIGAWGGAIVFVDRDGIIPDFDEVDHDRDDLREFFRREGGGVVVEAAWSPGGGYSWIIKTSIPHETFEIFEDGEPYCRGIVFALTDIPVAMKVAP